MLLLNLFQGLLANDRIRRPHRQRREGRLPRPGNDRKPGEQSLPDRASCVRTRSIRHSWRRYAECGGKAAVGQKGRKPRRPSLSLSGQSHTSGELRTPSAWWFSTKNARKPCVGAGRKKLKKNTRIGFLDLCGLTGSPESNNERHAPANPHKQTLGGGEMKRRRVV